MKPTINIKLDLPAMERWKPLLDYKAEARELIECYLQELYEVGIDRYNRILSVYRELFLPNAFRKEIEAVAKLTGFQPNEVLLANLYYDVLKLVLGCSAFAIDTPQGPLHARNLDWWSDGDLLSRNTRLLRFTGGRNAYTIVGWPGAIGAFSGMADGKFAITLNAVSSDEPFRMATPVTLLIREVLENAVDYKEAVGWLSQETLTSDCLLLVTGVSEGEMVVIERSPNKSAIREPENGLIVVTNNYLSLKTAGADIRSELAASSCSRYQRVKSLATVRQPQRPIEAFTVLNDPGVKMGITQQQMVFRAASATVALQEHSGVDIIQQVPGNSFDLNLNIPIWN